jgi:hypothetical protein
MALGHGVGKNMPMTEFACQIYFTFVAQEKFYLSLAEPYFGRWGEEE